MLNRRGLLTGFVALVAAPAIIRTPGLLMPVRALPAGLDWVEITRRCIATTREEIARAHRRREEAFAAMEADIPAWMAESDRRRHFAESWKREQDYAIARQFLASRG